MEGKTLYDKIWDEHIVHQYDDGRALLYIDKQLIHEVTSPQAFEGLKLKGRVPWRTNANVAVPDHNVPTTNRDQAIADPVAAKQIETLQNNCHEHGIRLFDINDKRQGIVHVMGPEQGFTLPGMTIVCGDSHTSTHGAFGTISMGIGTSEVEHVLASQCLVQQKMKNLRVNFHGVMEKGLSSKDLILALIGQIGTNGATGYAIEFSGKVIQGLSMEARMTICNMSIEAGAKCGLIEVDHKTLAYIHDRPFSPKGKMWNKACDYWEGLHSDSDAIFDKSIDIDVNTLEPQVTWGTSPEMVCGVGGCIPDPQLADSQSKRENMERALAYMNLKPLTPIKEILLDRVFIGSCTNARIEDLVAAAQVVKGNKVHSRIKQALVVPGSGLVKQQAEEMGLDVVFVEAGFEWREPGCSMCLAMNPDRLEAGEHCASTSNRNFEGRQGTKGCTHLVSPIMAAAAAIAGHFVDVRTWGNS